MAILGCRQWKSEAGKKIFGSNMNRLLLPFMFKRMEHWYLALVAFVTLSCVGCGTIITRYVGPNWSPPEPKLSRIYSGTVFDFRCFLYPKMHETQGIEGFCLVDVPFSIIADTVILPLTVYEQIKYGSYSTSK